MSSSSDSRNITQMLVTCMAFLLALEVTVCQPTAQQVLLEVRASIQTCNSNALPDWIESNPLTSWSGVEVVGSSLVVGLYLSDMGLCGKLPSAVSQLSALRNIDIAYNRFTGTVPAAWGALSRLTQLALYANSLSGPLPEAFGNCTQLTSVHFGDNSFTGTIPSSWNALTRMEFLTLSGNKLQGSHLSTFGWTALQQLWVDGNQFTGTLPSSWLTGHPNLKLISASSSVISGPLPAALGSATGLDTLWLGYNQITGSIPPQWSALTNLDSLVLSYNLLTGPLQAALGDCTALTSSLQLDGNTFTGTVPVQWSRLTSLKSLQLSFNKLTGLLPGFLTNLKSITSLGLNANQFSGPIPATWSVLQQLEVLALSDNKLKGPIPPQFSALSRLNELYIEGSGLCGTIPKSLLRAADVQTLPACPVTPSPSVPAGNGDINLQADNNKYLSIARVPNGAVADFAFVLGTIPSAPMFTLVQSEADPTKVGIRATNGNFLARCRWCLSTPGGLYPDAVAPHATSIQFQKGIAEAQWTLVKLDQLVKKAGVWGLQADTGLYMARCSSCVLNLANPALSDSAFVYVSEAALASTPAAHWKIAGIPAAIPTKVLQESVAHLPPLRLQEQLDIQSLGNMTNQLIDLFLSMNPTDAYALYLQLFKQGREDGGSKDTFFSLLPYLKAHNLKGKKPYVVGPNGAGNKPAPVRKKALGTPVKKLSGRRRALLAALWEEGNAADSTGGSLEVVMEPSSSASQPNVLDTEERSDLKPSILRNILRPSAIEGTEGSSGLDLTSSGIRQSTKSALIADTALTIDDATPGLAASASFAAQSQVTTSNPALTARVSNGRELHAVAVPLVLPTPDWSTVLPPPADQAGCSCCWATVVTNLVEATHYIKTGQPITLSYKQMLDCAAPLSACDGGTLQDAFKYAQRRGLARMDQYRAYNAVKNACPIGPTLPASASRLLSYQQLPPGNEVGMRSMLSQGPLAASVYVDDGWFDYAGGVYESTTCAGSVSERFNHAVLIVGEGVDSVSGVPYWKVRNSWGTTWGEWGYMRIKRGAGGNGMCNIAFNVYRADNAAVAAAATRQTPKTGCQPAQVMANEATSLAEVALKYNTSISQIMGDNRLDVTSKPALQRNQKLQINCPVGWWSLPFGYGYSVGEGHNAMSTVPTVGICPPGTYVVSIYVKPSQWYTDALWTGTTWVGAVNMTCSDGTLMAVNAQPGFDPGWSDGRITNINGFTSVSLRASGAIDSLLGVGATSGGTATVTCPPGMVLTGFAAGGSPGRTPGYLTNLQFQCSNPFVATTVLPPMAARQKTVPVGTLCQSYTSVKGDTWLSVASKLKVNPSLLVQSNTRQVGVLKAGVKLFIPPCVNGKVPGSVDPGKAGVKVPKS